MSHYCADAYSDSRVVYFKLEKKLSNERRNCLGWDGAAAGADCGHGCRVPRQDAVAARHQHLPPRNRRRQPGAAKRNAGTGILAGRFGDYIGGLGPTQDDLTKEVVAEVLGDTFVEDAAHTKWLQDRAALRGWQNLPPSFAKQALVPVHGRGIPNPQGTALGALFEKGRQDRHLPAGAAERADPDDQTERGAVSERENKRQPERYSSPGPSGSPAWASRWWKSGPEI